MWAVCIPIRLRQNNSNRLGREERTFIRPSAIRLAIFATAEMSVERQYNLRRRGQLRMNIEFVDFTIIATDDDRRWLLFHFIRGEPRNGLERFTKSFSSGSHFLGEPRCLTLGFTVGFLVVIALDNLDVGRRGALGNLSSWRRTMMRLLSKLVSLLYLAALGLIAVTNLAAKTPDAEDFARELVHRESSGFFEVTLYREVDRRTKDGVAQIRFAVVAELQRDAVAPITMSGPRHLSLSGLAEPSVISSEKPAGPNGYGYQLWRKGATLELEDQIAFVKYDEGWKQEGMRLGWRMQGPDVMPAENIGAPSAAQTGVTGALRPASTAAVPLPQAATLTPPEIPPADELAAKVTEFAAKNLKGLQRAHNLKITGPVKPLVAADGSATCSFAFTADFVFLQPAILLRGDIIPLPKVGEPCPTGTRMDFQQSCYWDANGELPYTGNIQLTKGRLDSNWNITVSSVTHPRPLRTTNCIWVSYQSNGNKTILTEVKIVPRS